MRPPRFVPGLIVGGLLGLAAAGALQVSSHGSSADAPAATANDAGAPRSILAPDTPEQTTTPPAKPAKPATRKPKKAAKRHPARKHRRRAHRKHRKRTHRVRAAAPARKYVPPPTAPRVYVAPKPVYVAPKPTYVAPRRTPPPPPPAPRPRPRPSPPPATFDDSG
jgi:hypothetical protein